MASSIEPTRRRRRDGQRAATLRDVAERAGVSTASASRALAHPAVVSAHVLKKVRDAASAVAYVPNASARSLSSSRAELVGAVLPAVARSETLRAFTAFERALSASGMGVLIAISEEGRSAADCAHWLERRGAAALALFGASGAIDPDDYKHRPWAVLDLGFDRAVELAARYLHDLGHGRLCMVGEPGFGGSARLQSSLSDLDDLGIDLYTFHGVQATEVGTRAVERLSTHRGDAPSALICDSDLVAASVLRACLGNGIGVPRDVSVIGIGESGLASLTQPTLTSVRIGAEDAGAAAARSILALLSGRSYERPLTTVKLVLRGSHAAPQ